MKPVICIAGPTASGKSAFAVRIAKTVGGEIINADSMQVYQDIQVLSARPSYDEMDGVAHHLFGYVPGDVPYSTGQWLRDVIPVILDCLARGAVPILTGGTGLYFKALLEGLADIPRVDSDLREEIEREWQKKGLSWLRDACMRIDPTATSRVLGDDPQRLERIYAVYRQTGLALSEWQKQTHPMIPKQFCRMAVLMPQRQLLYNKINHRFDHMVELGGLEEARRTLARGYDLKSPMMKAIGLSHLLRHLRGELEYKEAIELAKRDSRRLAKRQMTWFRNQTTDWPKLSTDFEQIAFMQGLIGLEI